MAKLANLVVKIEGDDGEPEKGWDSWMGTENKLLVVDIHKAWCGPCEVMNPTFRRLFLELDDSENRLQFLTADSSKISQLSEFAENPSCKPLFKLYKNGQELDTITGANAPKIQSLVMEHVPPYEED